MYTYFNRFLHHTLSHSGLIGESRSNKFASLFNLNYRVKPDNDSIENVGRSMVEMLGVLAIIGVLSVGAISGYSKAMFKYKLNKHTEQMNTLINAVARNVHSFDNIRSRNLTPYFIKMGEIPTEMVKSNDNNYVYDIFGQQWYTYIEKDDNEVTLTSYREDGSSFLSLNSSDSLAICHNILTVAKENSDNIGGIYASTANSDASHDYIIVGDKFCTDEYMHEYRCLKNLSLDDIYNFCAEHAKGGAGIFQFIWYL